MVFKIPDFQRSAGVELVREGWLKYPKKAKYPNSVPVPKCLIVLELQDGFFSCSHRGQRNGNLVQLVLVGIV